MVDGPKVELLIATSNLGKVRELQSALSELPIVLRHLSEFPNISTVEEVGVTYEANAILKAVGYAQQTGMYSLADDSGLEVDALNGRPGVLSARFGGEGASDSDRTHLLLNELTAVQNPNRTARFICCMAFAGHRSGLADRLPNVEVLSVVEAKCEGLIAPEPRGLRGFGYDPVFIPDGYHQTFGELPDSVKRRLSHRGKALSRMREILEEFFGKLDPSSSAP